MPRSSIVPLLVAIAALASGCGGGNPPSVGELEESVVLARDRADFALARITRAQSRDELLERMDAAAIVIDGAARQLDDLGAPSGYDSDVDEAVESLRQLAFDIQATADQIREPGFGDLLSGTRGLSFESWNRVNRALIALSRRGIEVEPLERHGSAPLRRATGGAFSGEVD